MTTLYFDCAMGAAGDMITAALLDIMPDRRAALVRLEAAGIPHVRYEAEKVVQNGITGSHVHVLVDGEEEAVGDDGHHHDHGHDKHDAHHHDHSHGEADAHHHHDHSHGEYDGHHHDYSHGEADAHHHHDHSHGEADVHHHHHGSRFSDIKQMAEGLHVSDFVKSFVVKVYEAIAQAESEVHGKRVEEIHFHEVGAFDGVADIAGCAVLLEMLKPDRIVVSPISVGFGTVRCAHGILPVPAPATAKILQGLPVVSGEVSGEMCTPTGAALLKTMTSEFGAMPAMTIRCSGFGFGTKVIPERLNAVRVILGEEDLVKTDSHKAAVDNGGFGKTDTQKKVDIIVELQANIDDMTGEAMGFALESLYADGAKEAFVTPVTTKKNRPGYLLTVLTDKADEETIVKTLFRVTTTLGIRRLEKERYILQRETVIVETPEGPVRVKKAQGYGVSRQKAEYDDIRAIALKTGKSPEEAMKALTIE